MDETIRLFLIDCMADAIWREADEYLPTDITAHAIATAAYDAIPVELRDQLEFDPQDRPHVSIDLDLPGYVDWWLDASARAGRPVAGWLTIIKRLRAEVERLRRAPDPDCPGCQSPYSLHRRGCAHSPEVLTDA